MAEERAGGEGLETGSMVTILGNLQRNSSSGRGGEGLCFFNKRLEACLNANERGQNEKAKMTQLRERKKTIKQAERQKGRSFRLQMKGLAFAGGQEEEMVGEM